MNDMQRTLSNLKYQIKMTKGDAWSRDNAQWGVMMEMLVEHLDALNYRLSHEHRWDRRDDKQGHYIGLFCVVCDAPDYSTIVTLGQE